MLEKYNHLEAEPALLSFWDQNKILDKRRKLNEKGTSFYFLEGPPYTSGRVHLGTAWNMALKDVFLRYKRMRGFNVWDRMGYDMHGLPTEQKVMAKLGLKNKEDILKFGLGPFTDECEKFCKEMMQQMNQDFRRLGATLDFSNPYQPISREYMEAEWWLIKRAYEQGRLYQGLRTMHWDAATQSAIAKHELEYKSISDTSLYMKFPHAKRKNTHFIIWTTTPWTIPLNLAIMANPELEYAEVEVANETWIIAAQLIDTVVRKSGYDQYKVVKKYKGKTLEGQAYLHPLDTKKLLPSELQKNQKIFTLLLSAEYVDASSGTGLVHCAPGCGPEDYEVGHLYHIPPFNCVNEEGLFTNFGQFSGLAAKLDDKKFVQIIDDAGVLLAKEQYAHDYPHGERSHSPVIFRTTKQWFFKVEDLKEKMVAANEKIYWNPIGGKNSFTAWLENLRDNSITKQRYWGTAVPIWQSEDGDVIVVASIKELEQLSGMKVSNMHIPAIDTITITKKDASGKVKVYTRIPDVLDVWIDAGTASWNCLDYPSDTSEFKRLFPPDFILEGKDQIRGWFNLLMVASYLAFDKPAFKNVYMHGFLNDVNGIKMSKSLGNIIPPDELIQKHGADVLRYYMVQTNAGEDINFSFEEAAAKARNLQILWNIHKLLLSLARENKVNPFKLRPEVIHNVMGIEEKYIFSKLHTTIATVTELLQSYRLDEIVAPLEDLYLELSRTYIQMIRDKSSTGDDQEKEVCTFTIATVLLEFLKMFSIIAPFMSEAIYQNLKQEFKLGTESIMLFDWPSADKKKMDADLEEQMSLAQDIMRAILSAREKAAVGVRWPMQDVVLVCKEQEAQQCIKTLGPIIKQQTNVKNIMVSSKSPQGVVFKIKCEFGKIGPVYGALSPQIIAKLTVDSPQTILGHLEEEGAYTFMLEGQEIRIVADMISVSREVPERYKDAQVKGGIVLYLDTERSKELEQEGYMREFCRNIQQLRKEAGLEKLDRIMLYVQASSDMAQMIKTYKEEIEQKVGAKKIDVSKIVVSNQKEFKIKAQQFKVGLEVVRK